MKDLIYLRRRMADELLAAERATSAQAAKAHRDMANRYLAMIDDEQALDPISNGIRLPAA